jgi:hypothetical protein
MYVSIANDKVGKRRGPFAELSLSNLV